MSVPPGVAGYSRGSARGGSGERQSWRNASEDDTVPCVDNNVRTRGRSVVQRSRFNFSHQMREPRGPVERSNSFNRGTSHDSSTASSRGRGFGCPGGGGTRYSPPRGRGTETGVEFEFSPNRRRGRENGRNHGVNPIRAKLSELMSQDPDEVIIFFTTKEKAFEELLQSEFDEAGGNVKLTNLLYIIAQKLCMPSNLVTQRNPLVAKCCHSSFLSHLMPLILELQECKAELQISPIVILKSLHVFAKYVSDKMPSQSPDKFLALARTAELVIPALSFTSSNSNSVTNSEEDYEELSAKFLELKNRIQEYKRKREEAVRSSGSASKSESAIAAMERMPIII